MSRFLIVDDSANNLYMLRKLLEGNGHEAVTAVNGTDALEKARTSPPDIVVSDILMPGMDGFGLCREWKKDDRLKHIPFVFYTATYTDAKDEEFALSLGADYFIIKPQEPEVFLEIIQSVFKRFSTESQEIAKPRITIEREYYKEYSETLIRKLQQKIKSLEQTAQSLEQEIADRKIIEEQLRSSEERYRLVVDNARDAIWRMNSGGIITFVSSSVKPLFGYEAEELIGQSILEIISHSDRGKMTQLIQQTSDGDITPKDIPVEMVHRRRDGSEFIGESKTTPIFDLTNRLQEIIGVTRDITEKKKMQEQLLQAQKMEAVGQLAGGVAHDFNNLLMVINGYADLIRVKIDPAHPIRADVDEIINAGNRASALTRQLLAFSRRQIIQPKTVNLNVILMDMDKMLRRLIGEDIEFITDIKSESNCIRIDPGQFEQIIMNLVVNARDAMPQGGLLSIEIDTRHIESAYEARISTVTPGAYVRMIVSDNGIGMDRYTLDRIFEPFFTTKEQGKGTGLGLSTVYGIVKQNQGHIFVRSETNRGTTFEILFPLVSNRPIQTTTKKTVKNIDRTVTVLVVEDDDLVRQLIENGLATYGFDVLTAKDGRDAIRVCEEFDRSIDLLLSDVIIPGISGHQLIKEIRRIKPKIEPVYMSGYTDDKIAGHGTLDEGIPFIQKPFTQEELAIKLNEILGQQRMK